MRLDTEGFRLTWTATADGADLTVSRPATRLAPLELCLRFLSDGRHPRLLVTMAFPSLTRTIDISTQPGVISQALADRAEGEPLPAGTRHSIVGGWISELAQRVGAWHPRAPGATSLDMVVGGAAFPMLGAAYEQSAGPVREIPMWAAPVLSQPTARAATETAFGAKATRPVVVAFASSLIRPVANEGTVAGPRPRGVNLTALALGLMGSPVLEPDQIVRVLRSARPGTVPSGEQISACQKVVGRLGPRRTERVLTEAGEADSALALLNRTVEMYAQVGHLLPGRLANQLEALHAQCRELMPRHPNPRPPAPATPPRAPAAAGPGRAPAPATPPRAPAAAGPGRAARPARRPPAPPREAPVWPRQVRPEPPAPARPAEPGRRERWPGLDRAFSPPPVTSTTTNPALGFPADIQGLDHTDLEGLRLVLPRTTYELTVWGQLMGNCLGSFGPAAAAGLSWLIGAETGERLVYCLELSPNRVVRQFLACRNRPVPRHHAQRVLEYLARGHVVDPCDPANRPWYR
ncbi:MAG: hypothetical protein ACLQVK_13055 [Acidimicrobiales bacterium]